jgi:hypothetical protein
MPLAGFETAVPTSQRPQKNALNHEAAGIGLYSELPKENSELNSYSLHYGKQMNRIYFTVICYNKCVNISNPLSCHAE